MKWHIFPIINIEQWITQWDKLNTRSSDSPLLTGDFLRSALSAFGTGRERLACLGDPSSPDCMAVLIERKRGVWETFQPAQAPIGFWLARPGLDIQNSLEALIRALPGFPLVVGLTQQDPVLMARPAESSRLLTLDYIETARIIVAGGFDAFWEKRGKNLRQNMRKARNKLEKAGQAPSLVRIDDADAMRAAVEHYGRLESAGWKARDGTAVNLNNAQGQFYLEILSSQAQSGGARVYQLMFNDTIAAMDLCVTRNGVIVILKTTYDESMADYSPAMLMHQELFQNLFESGEFKRIEFYGKVMDWHTRWTDDKRTLYHVNAYRWGWLKRILAPRTVASDTPPNNTDPNAPQT